MDDDDSEFEVLGLSDNLLEALRDSGYKQLTPIQAQAIPQALMGRDLIAIAHTGSGKTAAFTLPILEQLQGRVSRLRMPRCMILEPTRELALQVQDYFGKYSAYSGLNVSLLIGGVSLSNAEKNALNSCDVLIATPGRLLDHIERGSIMLADIKIFVIDEADRMLDMGFIPDIRKIAGQLPRIRQTLLFSATMPDDIRMLASDFMINPKEIFVSPSGTTSKTIEQFVVSCKSKREKYDYLLDLLDLFESESGIIFCNRKRDVKEVADGLDKRGFSVGALHGDMHQHLRMQCLQDFKESRVSILVCSDVAARGLDISLVDYVINFDVPNFAEDYVHRIGRTGRAGREGRAYSLVEPEESKALHSIEKLVRHALVEYEFPSTDSGNNKRVSKPVSAGSDKHEKHDKSDRGDKKASRVKHSKSPSKSPSKSSMVRDESSPSVEEAGFDDAPTIPSFLQKPSGG